MQQPALDFTAPLRFHGSDLEPHDHIRLTKQQRHLLACVADGRYRTLHEMSELSGIGEASLSAQLRHVNRYQPGSMTKRRRQRDGGTWEYAVALPRVEDGLTA